MGDNESRVFYLYAGNYKTGEIVCDIMASCGDWLNCEDRLKDMILEVGFSNSIWAVYRTDEKTREESEADFRNMMTLYRRVYAA